MIVNLGHSIEYTNELGQLHREDGPAVEYNNGKKEWWINGKLHRTDGPAREYIDKKFWFKNGVYHRENNLPAIEYIEGYKAWFVEGLRHREDGPAIIKRSGIKEWYLNDNKYTEEEYGNEIIKIKLGRLKNL